MRPKVITIDPDNVDADGLSVAAAVAAAGTLTLGGALTSGGTFTADYARQLGITSSGADDGRTFTITGTDANGIAQTEALTGPSTATVESTKYFKTVSSIAVDAACAGNISVGTVDEFVTNTIPLKRNSNAPTISLENVSGTIDVSVEQTYSNVFDPTKINYVACHADLTNVTSDAAENLDVNATGVRLVCNSYTNTAELIMVILQDGV
jgi:hypothetical protein